MKRLLLLLALAAIGIAAIPATASAAAVPCRDKIYNDWYHDGKIASTYPIACYRDALKHMRTGDTIYSSLSDDIHSALQAALERSHGKKRVPLQVGKGFSDVGPDGVLVADHTKKSDKSPRTNDTSRETKPPATATVEASAPVADTNGGGVPLPLLVLGALALLLAASGGVGMLVRKRRGDS
ncbi:MAG: hypothetical protein ACRDM1_12460 [Gaiellaceae bacterium]